MRNLTHRLVGSTVSNSTVSLLYFTFSRHTPWDLASQAAEYVTVVPHHPTWAEFQIPLAALRLHMMTSRLAQCFHLPERKDA